MLVLSEAKEFLATRVRQIIRAVIESKSVNLFHPIGAGRGYIEAASVVGESREEQGD
jgi:N12 class adenine-specific DNA methylase